MRRQSLALGAIAAVLAAVSLGNDFVLDDRAVIVENPAIRGLAQIPSHFGSDYREPLARVGLYRPLVITSFSLNYALGGLDPRGWHALDALLHGACSALLFLWLARVSGRPRLAAAAALLFAVHAVHAEVLANVASGRPELLAALFVLLSLLAYRDASQSERGVSFASVGCFAAALLCKESAATLLGLLPLVDACRASDGLRALRRRLPAYAPYLVVLLAYLGVRLLALSGGDVLAAERALDNPLHAAPPGWREATALWVAVRCLGLLLLPLALAYDYSYDAIPVIVSFGDPRLYAGVAVAGGLLAAFALAARRSREVTLGLGFGLITFSVVSNLAVPIGTILGERLLYLPSAGFCLVLAVGLERLAARFAPARAGAGFILLLGLLVGFHTVRAADRILDWRTENGLYLHDLVVQPASFKVQSNAGAALAERGRHEEALARFARARAIAPDFPAPVRGSVLSLIALGRFEQAQAMYRETLRFGPPQPSVEAAIRAGLGAAPVAP